MGLIKKAILLVLLLSGIVKADEALPCFQFSGPSGILVTHSGEQFTVYTTYANNCAEGTIFIGGAFNSTSDPYLAKDVNGIEITGFFDPLFTLEPGETQTFPFAWYQWGDVPINYVWTGTLGVNFGYEGNSDWKYTTFTTVVNPVPEPMTGILMLTGLAMIGRKLKRNRGN